MAQSRESTTNLTKAERRKNEEESLKSFLELTSSQLAAAWSDSGDRDHDICYKYMTPDFKMEFFPDLEFPWPRTKNLEDFIAHMENVKKVNPSWQVRAYNFSTSLNTELDSAVVWGTSGPSGNPGNSDAELSTNRESVCQFKWRKCMLKGAWECFGILLIRGGSSFGDLDWAIQEIRDR